MASLTDLWCEAFVQPGGNLVTFTIAGEQFEVPLAMANGWLFEKSGLSRDEMEKRVSMTMSVGPAGYRTRIYVRPMQAANARGESICGECHGSGQYVGLIAREPCPACKGTGKR